MSVSYHVVPGETGFLVVKTQGNSFRTFASTTRYEDALLVQQEMENTILATILGIDPSSVVSNWSGGTIHVFGTGFSENAPLVTVNGVGFSTFFESRNHLTCTFPTTAFTGTYDVDYSDGDGRTAVLTNGITIVGP